MTLRKGSGGKILVNNGQLVSGSSKCGCCLCCGGYSGDEEVRGDGGLAGDRLLEMDSGIYVKVGESTLVRGPDAGNFCELKFDLELTIHDPTGFCLQGGGGFPPQQGGGSCETTGELILICNCDVCPDGIVWDLRIEPCPGETCQLPSTVQLGGDCKTGNCDNPSCSDCFSISTPNGDTVTGGGFIIHDPDGGPICQCPGDYCSGEEEEEF